MPVEITNSLRSSSVVRATDPGTYTITLTNLSQNTSIETVNFASIKKIYWSTNGSILISRNSVNLLSLYNSGEMRFSDMGYSLANNSGSSIVVTITTGGSIVMEVTKDTTYSPALIA